MLDPEKPELRVFGNSSSSLDFISHSMAASLDSKSIFVGGRLKRTNHCISSRTVWEDTMNAPAKGVVATVNPVCVSTVKNNVLDSLLHLSFALMFTKI